jgi:hypothetical protein
LNKSQRTKKKEIELLGKGGSLTEMYEMKFHDGKNEGNEIDYG